MFPKCCAWHFSGSRCFDSWYCMLANATVLLAVSVLALLDHMISVWRSFPFDLLISHNFFSHFIYLSVSYLLQIAIFCISLRCRTGIWLFLRWWTMASRSCRRSVSWLLVCLETYSTSKCGTSVLNNMWISKEHSLVCATDAHGILVCEREARWLVVLARMFSTRENRSFLKLTHPAAKEVCCVSNSWFRWTMSNIIAKLLVSKILSCA